MADENLKEKFKALADTWEGQSSFLSYSSGARGEAYEALIAMGKDAIPFVLRKIADNRGVYWFGFLSTLMGGCPEIDSTEVGKIDLLAARFLSWAENKGYAPSEPF